MFLLDNACNPFNSLGGRFRPVATTQGKNMRYKANLTIYEDYEDTRKWWDKYYSHNPMEHAIADIQADIEKGDYKTTDPNGVIKIEIYEIEDKGSILRDVGLVKMNYQPPVLQKEIDRASEGGIVFITSEPKRFKIKVGNKDWCKLNKIEPEQPIKPGQSIEVFCLGNTGQLYALNNTLGRVMRCVIYGEDRECKLLTNTMKLKKIERTFKEGEYVWLQPTDVKMFIYADGLNDV